jgi:hypothetical protein
MFVPGPILPDETRTSPSTCKCRALHSKRVAFCTCTCAYEFLPTPTGTLQYTADCYRLDRVFGDCQMAWAYTNRYDIKLKLALVQLFPARQPKEPRKKVPCLTPFKRPRLPDETVAIVANKTWQAL